MTVPAHIAIIMDGNGRWAARRGKARTVGHQEGANAAEAIVEAGRRSDVQTLTLFAFSSENWRRPDAEIQLLLSLFGRALRRQVSRLNDNDIRIRFVGNRTALPPGLVRQMADAERRTLDNRSMELVVAINYGGRWDITQAARACARSIAESGADPDIVDEAFFEQHLSLADMPPPDLLIRTGGEKRISNFLLWDLAYSELYFTDELWPEFNGESLARALDWYSSRDRRFGWVPTAASASS